MYFSASAKGRISYGHLGRTSLLLSVSYKNWQFLAFYAALRHSVCPSVPLSLPWVTYFRQPLASRMYFSACTEGRISYGHLVSILFCFLVWKSMNCFMLYVVQISLPVLVLLRGLLVCNSASTSTQCCLSPSYALCMLSCWHRRRRSSLWLPNFTR